MNQSIFRLRSAAFRRQAGRCFYCGVEMWNDDGVSFALRHGLSKRLARVLQCTAEHLQARCEGGKDAGSNIAAACRLCNHRRHAQRKVAPAPEVYRQLVRKRVSRRRWHDRQVFERGLVAG